MNSSKYARSMVCLWLVAAVLVAAPGEKRARQTTANRIDFKVTVLGEDPFSPTNAVDTAKRDFRRGEVVTVVINGIPKPGYHTYPITQATATQGNAISSIRWDAVSGLKPLWPVRESKPEFVDTGTDAGVWLEYEKPFTWSQDIYIPCRTPQPAPRTSSSSSRPSLRCQELSLRAITPLRYRSQLAMARPCR